MKKSTSTATTTSNSPVFILVGPTAAGKSACALELAEKINGEIISADSMQVYRFMDIGTAKPIPADRARVPHHLIDIVNPDEEWSVAEFTRHAGEAIIGIQQRKHVPIICGGTGLYIRSLLGGYDFPPRDPTGDVRAALQKEADTHGAAEIHNRLKKVDPVSAGRISEKDLRRMIRALEVYELTGRPISSFSPSPDPLSPIVLIGLHRDRADLYHRINERVSWMLENGLINEVRTLIEKGYSPTLRSMQALGYQETVWFIDGHGIREELEVDIQKKTRNFGKRQMTWWRSFNGINWFPPDEDGESYSLLIDFCCNKLA